MNSINSEEAVPLLWACSLNPGTDPQWKYLTEHDPKFEGQRKLKIEGKELVSVPLRVFGLEGLMELIPREISHLRSLTLLYMDSNNLKEIPAEIGTLSNLERLTLSNNHLTSLPPEIGGLEKLHSLHLANNNFTELPAQLETLLLLFNSLKQLPGNSIRRIDTRGYLPQNCCEGFIAYKQNQRAKWVLYGKGH
uniref:Uncharacterized protein n=1 Tax=Gopherus evgoodei TaxID=1825980 RepID=A0A8C5EZJ0_9SAUR